jgi:acyl carrier protein
MDLGQLIQEVTGRSPVSLAPGCALSNMAGWDSLAMVRLMVRLEQHLGRELEEAELASLTTVGDIQRLLNK